MFISADPVMLVKYDGTLVQLTLSISLKHTTHMFAYKFYLYKVLLATTGNRILKHATYFSQCVQLF